METCGGIACGNETKMTRIWQNKDLCGRNIKPVPLIKCEQNGNTVILTERHFEIAYQKWFNKRIDESYMSMSEIEDRQLKSLKEQGILDENNTRKETSNG